MPCIHGKLLASMAIVLVGTAGLLFALNRAPRLAALRSDHVAILTGRTMGTTYTVKLAGLDPSVDRDRVATEVQVRLDRINDLMSTFNPDSELSRFNASRSEAWFPVSRETARVVAEAVRVGTLSSGALDVTVGPLVDLWSFGPTARPQGDVPSDEEITRAKASVNYRQLEIRLDRPALRKRSSSCRVDLSSLAKGFAVDQVAESLERSGICDYMVEVGGEVRTAGSNPDGKPWRIAVEVPVTAGRAVQRVVALGGRSMATSGDYHNYFERDGIRFCHIVDPRTGRPVRHRLASVSVIADTCMEADALATALFVLGPEEGLRVAADHNVDALFLVRTDQGFMEHPTPSFPAEQP